MPRMKPKGAGSPFLVEVREKEIPGWMRRVRLPAGETDLVALLNLVRWEPAVLDRPDYSQWLDAVARAGEDEYERHRKGEHDAAVVALNLLDLVPALAAQLESEHRTWLADSLVFVFTYRRYDLVRRIRRSPGRPSSDRYVAALHARFVETGMSPRAADTQISQARGVTVAAVRNARTPARGRKGE